MKIAIVFCVLAVLAVSYVVGDEIGEECSTETGVTKKEIRELLLSDEEDDETKATKFMMCYFKKKGVLDEEGELDLDKVKSQIKDYMKEVGAAEDQEAQDCVQKKESVEETVFEMARCVEKRKSELGSSK